MSLADELNNLHSSKFTCAVAKALHFMDPLEAEALQLAIDNRDISGSRIAYLLKAHGYKISTRTVLRHRARNTDMEHCSCP